MTFFNDVKLLDPNKEIVVATEGALPSLDGSRLTNLSVTGYLTTVDAAAMYAPISHSNNSTIHVTSSDKNNWNGKANASHTHTIANITNLQTALDGKVDKVEGKGLSTNDYSNEDKAKVNALGSMSEEDAADYRKKIDQDAIDNGKLDKNQPILAATSTKVTYDSNGLILSGTSLAEADIPEISQSKVTGLVLSLSGKVDRDGDKVLSDNNFTDTYITAISDLQTTVSTLMGAVVLIGEIALYEPTQEQLTDRAIELKSQVQLGYTLVDLDKIEWYYDGTDWNNIGQNVISKATSTVPGVVKGSDTHLEVSVGADGAMSVNGLSDALNGKVDKESGKSLMLNSDKTKLDNYPTTPDDFARKSSSNTFTDSQVISVNSENSLELKSTSNTSYSRIKYTGNQRVFTSGVGNSSATIEGLRNKFYIYDFTASETRLTIDSTGTVGIPVGLSVARSSISNNIVDLYGDSEVYISAPSAALSSTVKTEISSSGIQGTMITASAGPLYLRGNSISMYAVNGFTANSDIGVLSFTSPGGSAQFTAHGNDGIHFLSQALGFRLKQGNFYLYNNSTGTEYGLNTAGGLPRIDVTTGKLIPDIIPDVGVPEAPEDGKTYGRKDGEWSEVTGLEAGDYSFTGAAVVDRKLTLPGTGAVVAVIDETGRQYPFALDEVVYNTEADTTEISLAAIMTYRNLAAIPGTWKIVFAVGKKGDNGVDGQSFVPDARGTLAERDQYDGEAKGFSYLDVNAGTIYHKLSGDTADWSTGFAYLTGPQGPSGTISIGTVSSGETAGVTNSGTPEAAVFNFVLPKGDKGEQGIQGLQGFITAVISDVVPENPEEGMIWVNSGD